MNSSGDSTISLPQHQMEMEASDTDSSLQERNASTIPARTLDEYIENAYQEHASLHQWRYWGIMLALGISNSSDASEILCLSYILADDRFQDTMLLDSDWRGGMLAAAVFAGMLIGGLVVGTLGDWKGRRPMVLCGLTINMVSGLMSACSPNILFMTFFRMIAGVGIGATVPPLFTLTAELAPPSRRGLFMTFVASFWMVGSVFVALLAMLILENQTSNGNELMEGSLGFVAWRIFALTCALPCVLGAIMVYHLVPESPRFLAINQRYDEAIDSTNTISVALQSNGHPLTSLELEHQFGRVDVNLHPPHQFEEMGTSSATSWSSTTRWIQMALEDFYVSVGSLMTPGIRQTTWPLMLCWFSLSFSSYGLMTWINTLFFAVHLENVYFNALLFALSSLPGNLGTALGMDRIGRSQLLMGSLLSAALSLLFFAFFANTTPDSTKPPNTYGIVLSACGFQCFTTAAWNTVGVITSERFPTTVRSTGTGVCGASARVGAMIAQFVNGSLVGHPVRLLVIASIALTVGAMTPFLLPHHGDKTGKPVEDGLRTSNEGNDPDGSEDLALVECMHSPDKNINNTMHLRRGNGSYQKLPTTGGESSHLVV